MECGWDPENYEKILSPEIQRGIYEENRRLLDAIKADKELSDPFKQPVIELHPDLSSVYLTRISDPIDLRTITEKLEQGLYITPEMMVADLHRYTLLLFGVNLFRMLENCKKFLKSLFIDNKQKNVEKDQLYESANLINVRYLNKRKSELGLVLPSQD